MAASSRPRFSRRPSTTNELALPALVLAYGAASHRSGSRTWQIPANLIAATGAVGLAHAWGASWETLGLEPTTVPKGLRLGFATLPPICAVVALGLAHPATRRYFVDDRVRGSTDRELAHQALVRIPLATALAEELLFRSAVLGLALSCRRPGRAVATTAVAFGLWHIHPALRSHDASPAGAQLAGRAGGRAATVGATVLATTVAGAAFAWLRLRSRSIAAPIVAHAGMNVAGLLAAAWVARRDASARR